jgi:hypothetical protein
MRSDPPMIEVTELYSQTETMRILSISREQFGDAILSGVLRQFKKKDCDWDWYKGLDLLFYFFKFQYNK